MSMQGFRRFMAATASVVVGAASFALSFVALRDVSVQLEAVPPSLGWLVPIVIDGGVICGSAIIWSLSHEQRRRPVFPFLFVGSLVVVSVVVNAAHAGPTILAKLIASLPPLILLGTLELVAAQGRRQAEPATKSTSTTAVVPVAAAQAVNNAGNVAPQSAAPQIAQQASADRTASPLAGAASNTSPVSTTSPAPTATQASIVERPSNFIEETDDVTGFDAELETAVEEALAPASTWTQPETGAYNRSTTTSAQGRRRTARVRAEGPTF